MSRDLKKAYVYFSGTSPEKDITDVLNEKKGYLRKSIASTTNLKYNPMLIFSYDPIPDYEKRIDELLNSLKKNEKRRHRTDQEQDPGK